MDWTEIGALATIATLLAVLFGYLVNYIRDDKVKLENRLTKLEAFMEMFQKNLLMAPKNNKRGKRK